MEPQTPSASDDLFFRSLVNSYMGAPRFVARGWLAEEVAALLEEPDCRFVLLTAEPGAGKSTFLAQLAHDHPDWPAYFIRRDQRTPLSDVGAHSFLLRLGYQMAALHPELFRSEQVRLTVEQRVQRLGESGELVGAEIERILASPFYKSALRIRQEVDSAQGKAVGLRVGEYVLDPHLVPVNDLQYMALIDPAQSLLKRDPLRRIVILVDALDEIRYHPAAEESLLTWLTKVGELPPNARFVLTTRPPEGAVTAFVQKQKPALRELAIADTDKRVHRDVKAYVQLLLRDPALQEAMAKSRAAREFDKRLSAKAAGNMGYADAVGRAVDQALRQAQAAESELEQRASRQQLIAVLTEEELPAELGSLFAFFLNQLRVGVVGDDKTWASLYAPLLGVLAVAFEALTIKNLRDLSAVPTGWAEIGAALQQLRQFLEEEGRGRYRFYHASVSEFLTQPSTRDDLETLPLYQDARECHRRIADRFWTAFHPDWTLCTQGYGLRNLARHLYESGDNQRLQQLICREWMYARSAADSALSGFAEDVGLAWRSEAAQVPPNPIHLARLHAARLSVHEHAGAYSDIYLGALAAMGREREAIGLARFRDDRAARFQGLMTVFKRLTGVQEPEGGSAQSRKSRAETIAMLVEALQRVARGIERDESRAVALGELGAELANAGIAPPNDLFGEAEAILGSPEGNQDRMHGYRRLAVCLADIGDARAEKLYRQAIGLAIGMSGNARSSSLQGLAEDLRLPGMEGNARLLVETIRQMESARDRGYLLGWVTNSLMEIGRFDDAEKVARSIDRVSERAETLQQLADGLAALDRARAIRILRDAADCAMTDENSIGRAYNLGLIASSLANLGDPQADKLYAAAEKAANDPRMPQWNRRFALSHLARNLVSGGRLRQAERIAGSIRDPNLRMDMDEGLADRLAGAGRFDEAEQAALSIPHHDARDRSLSQVAGALTRAKMFDRAEQICRSIGDVLDRRSQALGELALALAQDGQLDRAIRTAQSMPPGEGRSDVFASLAAALAPADRARAEELLDLAGESVAGIERGQASWRHDQALSSLSAALAAAGEYRLSEAIARRIQSIGERVSALLLVAKSLREAAQEGANDLFDELGQIVRAPLDERSGQLFHDLSVIRGRDLVGPNVKRIESRRLADLSVGLSQAGECVRAEKLALSIEEPQERAKALIGLAGALAKAGSDALPRIVNKAEKAAQSTRDEKRGTQLLGELEAALAGVDGAAAGAAEERTAVEGDRAAAFAAGGKIVQALMTLAGRPADPSPDKRPLDDLIRKLAKWASQLEGADRDLSLELVLAAVETAGWVRPDWAQISRTLQQTEPCTRLGERRSFMDLTAIAAGALSVLIPYAKKGAEEFARIAGEAAYNKAKKLLEFLEARWGGDKEAAENLERFQQKPERYQPVLEDILNEKLAQDADLAAELKQLLEDLGPDIQVIQKMKTAKHVTGVDADQMSEGKARVQQDIEDAERVTGARIKRIGR